MTLVLELGLEAEEMARATAEAQGMSVKEYVRTVLLTVLPSRRPLPIQDWETLIRSMGVSGAAVMSDYAASRKSLYDERD